MAVTRTFKEHFRGEDFHRGVCQAELHDGRVVAGGLWEGFRDCGFEGTVELLVRVRANHLWVSFHGWKFK